MDFKPIEKEVMYTEAEAYFNLKVDLPKNNKYYTDCEIVEMLDDYHKERLNSVSEEDAKEPIQDALYSTGKFTTDQCDVLVDGILTNLKEYGILILKKK